MIVTRRPKETTMKVSARNHFTGNVREVLQGPVNSEVKVAIGPGIDIVATISTRAAQDLQLAAGRRAHVLIKASSVIVGVD